MENTPPSPFMPPIVGMQERKERSYRMENGELVHFFLKGKLITGIYRGGDKKGAYIAVDGVDPISDSKKVMHFLIDRRWILQKIDVLGLEN